MEDIRYPEQLIEELDDHKIDYYSDKATGWTTRVRFPAET
jgi:hypothetical protein